MTKTQETHEKKDFFVSYSTSDEKWAEWIAYQLEADGYSTIIQMWDWGAGSNFILEMQKATRACERTILVLSPAFIDSLFTQPEWAEAFQRDPTGERRLLIPIRVQKCELEGFFGPLVYIDFLRDKPPEIVALRDHLIKLLLDGVSLSRKKPSTEPPLPAFKREGERRLASLERAAPHQIANDRPESGSSPECLNEISGDLRKEVFERLDRDWVRSRRVVALLQGFPGTGKTRLARSITPGNLIALDPIQVGADSENQETDLLMDLATALEFEGIQDLSRELEKGEIADPFMALRRLLRREKILLIIDEFQRLFPKDQTCPPENWQALIESLNNAPTSEGKLLLISNRIVFHDRWNEGCVVHELQKFSDVEAADFLSDCLRERNLADRIPLERTIEIGRRLGGNPRAIQTLVGTLRHFTIDELLSTMPIEIEIGDVMIDSILLGRFEHGLISKAIAQLSPEEVEFMRWLAVNRRPIGRRFYSKICSRYPDWKLMRSGLIDRFLLEARNDGDEMHPLAREIAVTRLREDKHNWRSAHTCAADYQLELFESGYSEAGPPRAASFVEVRHHLFESGRLTELSHLIERMRAFVLSRIPKPTHSKVPRTTEVLEEHIVLIDSLPEFERSKGLEYHLALCLKARNCPSDYESALDHARKAVGNGSYYAVWLLLADLEFSLNGSDAMMAVASRAITSLGAGSNVSAVYHHCANLLDKDGRTRDAIIILEKAIHQQGIECKSALIALCVRLLDQVGEVDRASEMLSRELERRNLKHEGIGFVQWASMLLGQGQPDEAIRLIDRAISRKGMTKLYTLYLIKARALVTLGRREDAMTTLREGIRDTRIKDPVELFRELANLTACEGEIEGAVELLQSATSHPAIRDAAPLFHETASILEKSGEYDLGARLLGGALGNAKLKNDPTIYLACAKMHFRARNLEKASEVS